MDNLRDRILNKKITGNDVAVYWTGGMGYIIKSSNYILGLDLYLSDSCKNERDDFKRLVPPPLKAEDIELDYLIASHDHGDHLDTGSISSFINSGTKTILIGPDSVMKQANSLGVKSGRLLVLNRGGHLKFENLDLWGVFADHGQYSLDCIGLIISINSKNIYFTSDTCYRPDLPQLVNIDKVIDLLIVPINGKFGNPDSRDASYIAAWVKPKTVIPSHFWMFKEHGGDPGLFVEYCSTIAPKAKISVPAIGEELMI